MPQLIAKNRTRPPSPARPSGLRAHTSQCTICRHPQRAEIERDFLDWVGPRAIAREYSLGSHTTIYRHAHALGLFHRRRHTLQFALGRLIEQVDYVRPTAASIVSAIRLMAKINATSEYADEPESLEADSPEAADEAESGNGSTSDAGHEVAAREPAPVAQFKPAPPAPRAKPARPVTKGEVKKEDAGEEYNGPPITFARNVGPRRLFFWR